MTEPTDEPVLDSEAVGDMAPDWQNEEVTDIPDELDEEENEDGV